MNLIRLIDLPPLGDERGSLIAIEANKHIPFEVKRVYYIFGTKPGVSRGFHAHKMVLDDGINKESVWLDSPTKGLLIGNNVWREMHEFSDDCVLLVLASEHYDESDYIRDYSEFCSAVNK